MEEGVAEAPRRGAGVNKAALFNEAPVEAGFGVPPGQYIAYLVGADREASDDSPKESVKFTYEVAEGEFESKTISAWYNLFDKDGQLMRGGGFLKRDFEILEQPSLVYEELDNQLRNLADERIAVTITVKQNGQWTNVYLQGKTE